MVHHIAVCKHVHECQGHPYRAYLMLAHPIRATPTTIAPSLMQQCNATPFSATLLITPPYSVMPDITKPPPVLLPAQLTTPMSPKQTPTPQRSKRTCQNINNVCSPGTSQAPVPPSTHATLVHPSDSSNHSLPVSPYMPCITNAD